MDYGLHVIKSSIPNRGKVSTHLFDIILKQTSCHPRTSSIDNGTLFGRVLCHRILLFVNNNEDSESQSTSQEDETDPNEYTAVSRHPTH